MNKINIDLPAEEEYLAINTLVAEAHEAVREFSKETKVFSYLLKNSDFMVTNKGTKLVLQVSLTEASQKIVKLLKLEKPI